MRTVKIIATLGPATSSRAQIEEIVRAGVNVVRLNFSHGSHAEHGRRIAHVREVGEALTLPVAILQDLQGPKIRTGRLEGGEAVVLEAGQTFRICLDDVLGNSERVSTTYEALAVDVKPGDRLLLSDGLIELRAVSSSDHEVVTEVVYGGSLAENQGINLPGVQISAPGLTEKDIRDLAFGLEQDVDFIALSFVRRAADVLDLKERIAAAGRQTPVIAKIEKPEAITVIDDILEVSDGIMVARGDLGVELSPERVPPLQKRLIELANSRSKPVITATQMMDSMVRHPAPTRAEASDVANAILDGSDAIMLSAETAVGKYPVETVETMMRVANEVVDDRQRHRERRGLWALAQVDSSPRAISAAVAAIVRSLPGLDAVWVISQSGSTARLVAHHRLEIPVVAFTPNPRVYRQLALLWGVAPVLTEQVHDADTLERIHREAALHSGVVDPGDTVVVTGSHPFQAQAETNFLKIQRID